MSIIAIKRDFKSFIEHYITGYNIHVYTTYNDSMRTNSPSVVVDVISSRSVRTLKSNSTFHTKVDRLVNVVFVSDDLLELDTISDLFENYFTKNPDYFSSCFVFGISSITPITLAFEEKEDVWKRTFVIEVKEIL